MTKSAASISTASELKKIASPIKTAATETYIGFRTTRYSPCTTNTVGGSTGASVPFPSAKNCQIDHTSPAAPDVINANPRYRSTPRSAYDVRIRKYGIIAATVPGKRNVKNILRSRSIYFAAGVNATIRSGAPLPPLIFIGSAMT